MKNNNTAIIRRLTRRSLSVNKKRNLFLVLAVFLTTLLLGAVFSIGGSLLESQKTENLRLTGTTAHGGFPYPTTAQTEKLKTLDYVKMVGLDATLGFAKLPQAGDFSVQLIYMDFNSWEYMRKPARDNVVGSYPQAEDEIMMPLALLEKMGIQPEIGAKISLTYSVGVGGNDALATREFRLTGWYTDFGYIKSKGQVTTANISEALFKEHGLTVEATGAANLIFADKSRIAEYAARLKTDLRLSENQEVITGKDFEVGKENALAAGLSLAAIAAFLVLTGYLLIYNVLYISVSHDVRFYGLLKTLGTTPKQIKSIVRGQVLLLSAIGIPLGATAALLLSAVAVPAVLAGLNVVSTSPVVSFSPFIYLGAAAFALFTALLGAMKPAKKAAEISPVEAQRFTGLRYRGRRTYRSAHGKPYRMAWRNIFRDKKRAAVVLCSLTLGISTFLAITTAVSAMDMGAYIDTLYPSDFALANGTLIGGKIEDGVLFPSPPDEPPQELFDSAFLAELQSLPGLSYLSVSTSSPVSAAGDNLLRFIGVDEQAIDKAAADFDSAVDISAFKRGEFALLSTGESDLTASAAELFSGVSALTVTPILYENEARRPSVTVPLGGCAPDLLADTQKAADPTLIVSDALMRSIFGELLVREVSLDVLPGYEKQTLELLKALTENTEITVTSKLEALEAMKKTTFMLFVLGGGISLVIALIGILNFVNVMSTGILVRKNELAALESIGMERKKIRQMLRLEGLGYAVIALALTATLGTAAAYGIFSLLKLQADYAVFTYPFIPMAALCLFVIAVCLVVPERVYRSVTKTTVVERLREAE